MQNPNNIYFTWRHPDSELYIEDYLYDLENDIFEKNNLIKDSAYDKIKIELAAELKERMTEAEENIPIIVRY